CCPDASSATSSWPWPTGRGPAAPRSTGPTCTARFTPSSSRKMPDNSGASTPGPEAMLDQDTKRRVVLPWTAGRTAIALVAAAAAAAALADGTAWIAPPEAAALRNPVAPSPLSWQHGGRLFARHCSVCHGEAGKGDGPESG